MKHLPALPPSATHLGSSIAGLGLAFATLYALAQAAPGIDPLLATAIILAATALPSVIADLFISRRYRDVEAGLRARRSVSYKQLAIKYLGFVVTLGSFALLYRLLPEYQGSFYRHYYRLLSYAVPAMLLVAPFYFYWCQRRLDQPRDGYNEVGELALLRIQGRDWAEIGRHYRNWLVKAFFLPLMLTFTVDGVGNLLAQGPLDTSMSGLYAIGEQLIMFADLLYATVGYIFTLRILNAHIRSSDPTFKGWVVAAACYAPFWQGLLYGHYFSYNDALDWQGWLRDWPALFGLWGYCILSLLAIYMSATVCLGIRFSNLTYRGLITSGPYRYSKHPAYVAKNLSWWMVSIPFISHEGAWAAAANSALLLGVNLIYFLRARTEEAHLSNYPEYVAYALAMNERSIFRGLNRWLPCLKYKVPANPPRI